MGKKNSDIVQGKIRRDAPFEPLYNLTNDLSQTENVVTANPAIAHELGALLKQEQERIPQTKRIGWINIRKALQKEWLSRPTGQRAGEIFLYSNFFLNVSLLACRLP